MPNCVLLKVTRKATGKTYSVRLCDHKRSGIADPVCSECNQPIINGDRTAYVLGGSFGELKHLGCMWPAIERIEAQRERMAIRSKELFESGGHAGTYHKRGGRVIRGTGSC